MSDDVAAVLRGERRWALVEADCLQWLPTLPNGCCDAVVTDPPFGIRFDRATWSDSIDDYPCLMKFLVREANRLVICGRVFVFQAMLNCARFHEWFPEGWRIFAACKNFAQIRPTCLWHSWDPVIFWENGKPLRSPDVVNRDYHVGNVAGVFRDGNGHPCPRPLDTMIRLVEIAALGNQIVLDPFSGSGTTGVACLRTGRRFLGCEIDPAYAALARKRLEAEEANQDAPLYREQVVQPPLFTE